MMCGLYTRIALPARVGCFRSKQISITRLFFDRIVTVQIYLLALGRIRTAAMLALLMLVVAPVRAEVVRFEILTREPFAGGESFGDVGSYERIVGRVYYELDPELRQNKNVVDLKLAPKNERGKVELFGDLFVLAPKELLKGNGAILYDVNNRGNKLAPGFFNRAQRSNDPSTKEHAGDGFLMRNGFTIVWSGWDGELLPGGNRLRLSPPVASKEGKPIKGIVRW